MRRILEKVRSGEMSIEEAERILSEGYISGNTFRYDLFREERTGVPEIILADGKATGDIINIAERALSAGVDVVVSRIDNERAERVISSVDAHGEYFSDGRVLWLYRQTVERTLPGTVAVVTAGTSDIPVAEEAAAVLRIMGASVKKYYDIGIAGPQRMVPFLDDAVGGRIDLAIVCAGREGALPTVLSAMVDIPIIGVPVSVGYGFMGDGMSALSTMLQSCSPLAVVNIDAGVIAAMMAAKILKISGRVENGKGRHG